MGGLKKNVLGASIRQVFRRRPAATIHTLLLPAYTLHIRAQPTSTPHLNSTIRNQILTHVLTCSMLHQPALAGIGKE